MTHTHSKSPNDGLLTKPLAIVGMACRLPGADGLDEFWQLLRSGGYAIDRVPDSKLNRELYFDPAKGQRGKTYSEVGGFISQREIDWSLLPIDQSEASDWDPCHLIFCEVAAAACRDAGWNPHHLPLRKGSVFVGHSGGTTLGGETAYRTLLPQYVDLLDQIPELLNAIPDLLSLKTELLKQLQEGRPSRTKSGKPLVETGFASSIVGKALGLTGPHMSIDAACASSLVALALGAASLQTGQSEFAIIGGASFNKSDSLILFSQAQSCSASGSRPFDEAADGLISSEGYVAIVLKTLERAEADGDRVHAIIRGIGISSDGRGKSLWAPRKEGQYAAIRRAYSTDVSPSSISMIEAHATSTQVGDATEMEALSQFFAEHCPADHRIPVGSVKSNIGHTLETAGLAGVVKSVLAIQHATIPPSVNVANLSRSIPWRNIPLYVASQITPWPTLEANLPRRAAINAFGIGGLNVHVVVEQHIANQPSESSGPDASTSDGTEIKGTSRTERSAVAKVSSEPIAVIGRGLVVPGAASVEQLQKLIQSGVSQIGMPPQGRFGSRDSNGLGVRGGFVRDFEYDWRKHKVPPKQIAQANPLQFMLLEAAEQALRESKCLDREFDRQNTAVIVGSIFGGDFGNALYSGLRLPEFKLQLSKSLLNSNVSEVLARKLTEDYEAAFLKVCPALLDETGSFTSSTLASRLSKTFDLMGGAMAIDSGDVSSFAALQAAIQLLATGTVNQVLCAAAHRALDTASVDTLRRLGRLRDSASPDDNSGYYAGEGVAAVMLKRLSDARRDGDNVLAIIDDIAPGFDANSLKHSVALATGSLNISASTVGQVMGGVGIGAIDRQVEHAVASTFKGAPFVHSKTLPLTGHLQAAQGLTDLIAVTLEEGPSATSPNVIIAGHTFSGQSYVVAVRPQTQRTQKSTEELQDVTTVRGIQQAGLNRNRIWRFAANELAELRVQINECCIQSATQISSISLERFSEHHNWRACIVCSAEEINAKLKLLAGQIGIEAARVPLGEQGVYWGEPTEKSPRVAWLFPGQGSQYQGMLESLAATDPVAIISLEFANSLLRKYDQLTFEQIAGARCESLGENVWHTQAAMLIADWVVMECLRHRGFEPNVVSGHSFGEFVAMLAAGCWDLETALQATWQRCRSITSNVPAGCSMLSIHAERTKIEQVIREEGLPLFISHVNAPEQVVAGGKHSAIATLAAVLDNAGIGTRILAVPTAFHTPSLLPAQPVFRQALTGIRITPPRVPFLSSVTLRYEAEPSQLIDNLVQQLVQPVDFNSLCHRLKSDDVGLVIEVGPQQVLSRLIRQNLGNGINVVPTDHAKRGAAYQLQCAEANLELFSRSQLKASASTARSTTQFVNNPKVIPITLHFDATQKRRERMRNLGRSHSQHVEAIAREELAPTKSVVPANIASPQSVNVAAPSVLPDPKQSLNSQSATDNGYSTPEVAPKTVGHGSKKIESFLIDFVVEQTGYPADIIELDWDIEADLGIDSIKKAQLFGELREFFDLESLTSFSLDSYKTLRDIAKLLEQTPGKGEWLESQNAATDLLQNNMLDTRSVTNNEDFAADYEVLADVPTSPSTTSSPISIDDGRDQLSLNLEPHQLQQFLIDFVVEQTGYPPEIVDLDADLEADLGIDSIKKAQLFGELREMFNFSGTANSNAHVTSEVNGRQTLADYRTLRNVMDALLVGRASGAKLTKAIGTSTAPAPEELRSAQIIPTNHDPQPIGMVERVPIQNRNSELLPLQAPRSQNEKVRANKPCNWPLAIIDQAGRNLQLNSQYKLAVNANLRSMVGRKVASNFVSNKNGNGAAHSRYELPLTSNDLLNHLSACTETLPQSLLALDKTLRAECIWTPNAGTFFATMHWPKWLEDGGGEIAGLLVSRVVDRPTVAIAPAGCTMATAAVHNFVLLVVGGITESMNSIASEHQTALSNWICNEVADCSFDQAVKSVRGIKVNVDWWVKLIDARTGHQAFVESRDGVLVIERSVVSEVASPSSERLGGLAIELDLQAQCFSLVVDHLAAGMRRTSLLLNESLFASGESSGIRESTSHISQVDTVESTSASLETQPATIASRYMLQMVPAPLRAAPNQQPILNGAALVVGDNTIARQLEARLRGMGRTVTRLAANEDPRWLATQLDELWKTEPVAHLFLTTPCDVEAKLTLNESLWKMRRNAGIMGNYWLCQRWLNRVMETGIADDASIFAVTAQGGDFGFSGNMHSAEGGALAGLLKSILVESWMQGVRTMPIKILDIYPNQSPSEVVESIFHELANPSYNVEVSYRHGVRNVVRAVAKPIVKRVKSISRGGTWVCTGGARGITAFVAEQLATRYGLKLHLLGKTEAQQIDPSWRDLGDEELRRLRAQVMTAARDAGKNPVQTWQDTEKVIEIDATLRRFADMGIDAYYHACDVADRASVRRVLEKVRSISGPIEGILHGAGVGKDARFDRKQPEKVDQCISAKIDGAFALMDATERDPIKYFVGFGSISGRFGANGHTDYSLSNEMLCKQMDWLKHQRPDIRAVGFHWHAWGDVGMATKPETKLALEMIDMQFMPASEGIQHLIAELESDSQESEVLITDERYYRMYFHSETLTTGENGYARTVKTPLLRANPMTRSRLQSVFTAEVAPARDPFLVEHTLDRTPLLPFVIASEMLIEGAAAHLATNARILLQDIEAVRALRFFSPTARELRVEVKSSEAGSVHCKLMSDFFARDGRLIESNRVNFQAKAFVSEELTADRVAIRLAQNVNWMPVKYPAADAQFHVGLPLQRLRKVALSEEGLIGKISAPALIELAGTRRDLEGWRIPSSAMDACLFATGILAWQRVAPGTALPVRIGSLEVGRLPTPGEACQVHVRLVKHNENQAIFDFTLYGIDGDVILNATGYEVAWLAREASVASSTVE